jgi:hypothetical protein
MLYSFRAGVLQGDFGCFLRVGLTLCLVASKINQWSGVLLDGQLTTCTSDVFTAMLNHLLYHLLN